MYYYYCVKLSILDSKKTIQIARINNKVGFRRDSKH